MIRRGVGDADDGSAARPSSTATEIAETCRVVLVAGITYGAVVAGVGGRLAMGLLRITSPRDVIGVRSDDGFVIGRVTFAGTYQLLTVGAAIGIIGAGAYLLVAPQLLGPRWVRRLTVGLACGAVAGSLLVHTDGVDFTRLGPTWLAVALFVVLPCVFGVWIDAAVAAVRSPRSWTTRGRRRWRLPVVLLASVAPAAPVALAAIVIVGAVTLIGRFAAWQRLRATVLFGAVTRVGWAGVAGVGLVSLLRDITELT